MLELLSLLAFFAVLLYLYLGSHVFGLDRHSPIHRLFFLICCLLAMWAAGFMIGNYSPDKQVQWLTYKISALAFCTMPALSLHWFLLLTRDRQKKHNRWLHTALYIPAVYFLWQAWFGVLIVTDFRRIATGWVGVPATGSIGFYIYLLYTISFYFASILCAVMRWMRSSLKRERMQALIIGSSMFVSLALGTAFDLILTLDVPVNSSIFIMIWAFGTWYSIRRYRFLATTPSIVFEEIFANIRDLVVFIDPEGIVLRVNQEMASLLEKKEGDVVGQSLGTIIRDHRHDDPDNNTQTEIPALRMLHAHAGTGLLGHHRTHMICINARGYEIPISGYRGLIRDKNGEDAGSILIAQDMRPSLQLLEEIAARKKTQEALARARDELEQKVRERTAELEEKNRQLLAEIDERQKIEEQFRQAQKMEALGQLAGGVAHDLNNLLTPILGYADFIGRSFPSDNSPESVRNRQAQLAKWAGAIKASAGRASDLIKKLLTVSRKAPSRTTEIDVHEIITEVTALLSQIVDRGITISTSLQARRCVINADQSQVHSALLNLAINARDAMPEGGILTFETSVCMADELPKDSPLKPTDAREYLVIKVRDTGIGMTPDVRKHIFDPFFTTKAPGKGTGLGLTSVYRTVGNFGGTITVWSEPGTGTVFTIWYPLVAVVQKPFSDTTVIDSLHGVGVVLVVDDEPEICNLASAILSFNGFTVETRNNVPTAIAFLEANTGKTRVVVTDLNMPGINGQELIAYARQNHPQLPIIVMTGNNMPEKTMIRPGLEPDAIIQKPFDSALLLRTVCDLATKNPAG